MIEKQCTKKDSCKYYENDQIGLTRKCDQCKHNPKNKLESQFLKKDV